MHRNNENREGLRVIKTARTSETINEAARAGFFPLVKPVSPSPEIGSKYAVWDGKDFTLEHRRNFGIPEFIG
ncbi:MAG: hypothetical protein WCC69_06635 [Pirellulales bacterium]